jgi:hypothetical protein
MVVVMNPIWREAVHRQSYREFGARHADRPRSGGLNEHAARMSAALLRDPAVIGWPGARLPHETGNASSATAGDRAVIANPKQVRIIAHVKTDTVDAKVLAQLRASGFPPEVWIPDEPTQALRRQ